MAEPQVITPIDYSQEVWRDIPGYESLYQVSSFGRIKHLKKHSRSRPDQIHRLSLSWGYPHTNLYKNNKATGFFVHRIVAEVFLVTDPERPFVNHKDCDRTNNRVDNLEWCTAKENMQHASKKGRMHNGDKNFMRRFPEMMSGENHWTRKSPEKIPPSIHAYNASFTAEQVRAIRQEYDEKRTPYKVLATRYGVTNEVIGDVVRRRTYKDII